MASTFTVDEEEAKLDGAPTGELYVTTVKERPEIEPLEGSPDDELNQWIAKLDAGELTEWFHTYEFISHARQIAVHHSATLTPDNATKVIDYVCEHATSTRSVLANNALNAACELAVFAGPTVIATERTTQIAAAILENTKKLKAKVLRDVSTAAIDEISTLEDVTVVSVFAAAFSTPDYSGGQELFASHQSMRFTLKACEHILAKPDGGETLKPNLSAVLKGLSSGLGSRSADAKKCARDCCNVLSSKSSELGASDFSELVDSQTELSGSEMSELKASMKKAGGKAASAQSGKLSIAELKKRKKAEKKKADAETSESNAVVAADEPPPPPIVDQPKETTNETVKEESTVVTSPPTPMEPETSLTPVKPPQKADSDSNAVVTAPIVAPNTPGSNKNSEETGCWRYFASCF